MSKSEADKNNLVDFLSGQDPNNEPTETLKDAEVSNEKPTGQRRRKKAKLGRRSFKRPNVTYARLTIDIPERTKELLDLARIKSGNPHKGKHSAVIVDEALRAYLEH